MRRERIYGTVKSCDVIVVRQMQQSLGKQNIRFSMFIQGERVYWTVKSYDVILLHHTQQSLGKQKQNFICILTF